MGIRKGTEKDGKQLFSARPAIICLTQVLIERWRKEYNTFRPHSSLNHLPPAPEAILTTWTVGTTPGDPFTIPGGQGIYP